MPDPIQWLAASATGRLADIATRYGAGVAVRSADSLSQVWRSSDGALLRGELPSSATAAMRARTSQRRLERLARVRVMVEGGMSVDEVADALGVRRTTAAGLIRQAVSEGPP